MKSKRKLFSAALALICALTLMPVSRAEGDTATLGQRSIVSAGNHHSAVIDSSHTLWSWGSNQYGQVGNGGATTSTQNTPVKVLDNVVSVSCGAYFTAAVKEDGTLWMWGQNDMGQLGDGTTSNRYTPVQVLDQVAAVSCGYSHTAAIRSDGSLWVWGHNLYGQLGTNGVTNSVISGWAGKQIPVQTVPVKIMNNVTAASCGDFHTAAVKTDGTLWVWGYNTANQLRLENIKQQMTPVQVRSQVKTVCCGDESVAFIDSSGSLTVWGSFLGSAPTWKDITSISWKNGWRVGYIRANDSLWTVGYDYMLTGGGKPVKQLDNVSAVACGGSHILAVQKDGSVWAWGFNGNGQIGNGGLGEVDLTFGTEQIQKTPYKLAGITAAIPGTTGTPTQPQRPAGPIASPTNDKLEVNGAAADPTVYKIGGSNYFKIRDVAALLDGTEKQFAVGYDGEKNAVTASTGQGYAKQPGDLTGAPAGGDQTAAASNDAVYVNGEKITAEVYKIGGSNYFKLRDLGKALDFYVGWTQERGMYIETDKPYSE